MADPADGCCDGLDCSSKCVKPSETTLPGHLLELPDLDPGIFLSCHRAGINRNFPASTLVYTAIPDSIAGDGAGQHAQRHLPGPRPFSG